MARSNGALGGKLLGAGGGGFFLLFAPPERHRAIREALNKLVYVPFRFEFSGSQVIFMDREQDYLDVDSGAAPPRRFRELDSDRQRSSFCRERTALTISSCSMLAAA